MPTLKECFEQAGCKFPFTVVWYGPFSDGSSGEELTFVCVDEDQVWHHTKSTSAESGYNAPHFGWACSPDYVLVSPADKQNILVFKEKRLLRIIGYRNR
jgi:hypothetical protein